MRIVRWDKTAILKIRAQLLKEGKHVTMAVKDFDYRRRPIWVIQAR